MSEYLDPSFENQAIDRIRVSVEQLLLTDNREIVGVPYIMFDLSEDEIPQATRSAWPDALPIMGETVTGDIQQLDYELEVPEDLQTVDDDLGNSRATKRPEYRASVRVYGYLDGSETEASYLVPSDDELEETPGLLYKRILEVSYIRTQEVSDSPYPDIARSIYGIAIPDVNSEHVGEPELWCIATLGGHVVDDVPSRYFDMAGSVTDEAEVEGVIDSLDALRQIAQFRNLLAELETTSEPGTDDLDSAEVADAPMNRRQRIVRGLNFLALKYYFAVLR